VRKTITISPHRCKKCARLIKPGTEVYVQGKINEDGHYINEKFCLVCDEKPYDAMGQGVELRSLRA